MDFWGGEYADNDVKRIVTKSGNRIQMVDKPGQEAISLSTPDNLKISMYEQANETGRPMIEILNRNGDISFLAPDGRIHFHSQLFSREVGGAGATPAPPDEPSIVYRGGLGAPHTSYRVVPAGYQEREEEPPEQVAKEEADFEKNAREIDASVRARQLDITRQQALKSMSPEQLLAASEAVDRAANPLAYKLGGELKEATKQFDDTPENGARMRQGLPPIGRDSKPVQLPELGPKIPSAIVDTRKFSDYVFKEGATHGKDAVFRGLGYGPEDSQSLAEIYGEQASGKYASGNYSAGREDQFGQRISIEIELPGRGSSAGQTSYLKSGWLLKPDGNISLTTPFAGFTR